MPVPYEPELTLPEEDKRGILLAQSYAQMVETMAWKDFWEHVTSTVDDAQNALLVNVKEPSLDTHLATRWRLAIALRESMAGHVKSHVDSYQEVLQELKDNPEEPTDEHDAHA